MVQTRNEIEGKIRFWRQLMESEQDKQNPELMARLARELAWAQIQLNEAA